MVCLSIAYRSDFSLHGYQGPDKHFSVKKIRQYFRNRKPLASPDVDGWRGREHLAWMFMNNDTEFQELIRTEFLLPYLTNEFLQIYSMPRKMQEASCLPSSKPMVDYVPLYVATLGGDASRLSCRNS